MHGLVPKWALVAGPGEPPVAGMRKPPVAGFGESLLILSSERLLRMAPPVAGPGEPLVAAWVLALLTRARMHFFAESGGALRLFRGRGVSGSVELPAAGSVRSYRAPSGAAFHFSHASVYQL